MNKLGFSFVQNIYMNIFGYSFVSKNMMRIYLDIHLSQNFETNIFGYSFESKFWRMPHSESNTDDNVEDLWKVWEDFGKEPWHCAWTQYQSLLDCCCCCCRCCPTILDGWSVETCAVLTFIILMLAPMWIFRGLFVFMCSGSLKNASRKKSAFTFRRLISSP